MPLEPALGVRETVAGHTLGALEWGGLPMCPWSPLPFLRSNVCLGQGEGLFPSSHVPRHFFQALVGVHAPIGQKVLQLFCFQQGRAATWKEEVCVTQRDGMGRVSQGSAPDGAGQGMSRGCVASASGLSGRTPFLFY